MDVKALRDVARSLLENAFDGVTAALTRPPSRNVSHARDVDYEEIERNFSRIRTEIAAALANGLMPPSVRPSGAPGCTYKLSWAPKVTVAELSYDPLRASVFRAANTSISLSAATLSTRVADTWHGKRGGESTGVCHAACVDGCRCVCRHSRVHSRDAQRDGDRSGDALLRRSEIRSA